MNQLLNRKRAERIFGEAGVQVVIATTHANVFYVSGFLGFGQRFMPSTQVYAIAHLRDLGSPEVILPAGELDVAAQFPPSNARMAAYGRFFVEEDGADGELSAELARYARLAAQPTSAASLGALTDAIDKLPKTDRLAVDERGIAPGARDALKARYGARIIDGAGLLEQVRMVKTEEEIRRLARATDTIEKAYQAAMASAAEGISEAAMATVMDTETIRLGCVPAFSVVAFGERSALPNAVPGDRRLRAGDIIRFDIGCRAEGYYSDIARTAVFGRASEKQDRYYRAILEGEEAAIRRVRAGVPVNEIFATAVDSTRRAGIPHYRRHHVGHGIGLDVYDPPVINETNTTLLEAGMVLEVETPYYELGFGGIQVEDTILVTEQGHRRLTGTSSDLVVLV